MLRLRPPLPGREDECQEQVRLAGKWLQQAEPVTFNQRVFQLLGIGWTNAKLEIIQPFADRILALQQKDGGWTQLAGLPTDSWATGQALVALHQAGKLAVTNPVYRRGVDFLLRTQFEDGSWFVRSRTWPFQPHFDSGFPHGKDQWISAGGTAWACMALLLTQPEVGKLSAIRWDDLEEVYARAQLPDEPKKTGTAGRKTVRFAQKIKPVLERSCLACHAGKKPKGGLDLSTRKGLLKGGDSGEPSIVPENRHSSLIPGYVTDQVEDLEMPPLRKRSKFP